MEIAIAIAIAEDGRTAYLAGEPVTIEQLRWSADTAVWMARVSGGKHEHTYVGVDELSTRIIYRPDARADDYWSEANWRPADEPRD